jgi:chemotaxis protein MotA
MFAIIGIVVVFGAVVAGYLMEHGNLKVLLQPAELLIIGGAAAGTVLIANPLHILKQIAAGIAGVFGGSKFSKQFYLESLKTIYELFNKARREGVVSLESDIEEPEKSPILSKNPAFIKNHHIMDFFCDSMRIAVSGMEPFDLDQVLDLDLEVHHQQSAIPISALSTTADSLPGLGIVAAVLGVVITMGALGGPPEEIGHKVAAALVGTFLGILLCYGLIGPIASNMAKAADEEHAFLHVLRVLIFSFLKGTAPIMAVEVARAAPYPGMFAPLFKSWRRHAVGAEANQLRPLPKVRPHRNQYGEQRPPYYHYQKESWAWWTPRRRLAGCLCGFRHGHDGALYCALVAQHQQARERSDRRIFPRSFRHSQQNGQQERRGGREFHHHQR